MKKAIYPGTFDPITFGHIDLIKKSLNIFLYEKSDFLKKIQNKKINDSNVKWINNFKQIKKGPVVFFWK